METASGKGEWKGRMEQPPFPFEVSIRSFHSQSPFARSTRSLHSLVPFAVSRSPFPFAFAAVLRFNGEDRVKRFVASTAFVITGLLAAPTAVAQVGHLPTQSPYVDLAHSQELTFFGGEYHAHRDAANVGPLSGPIFGVHYEWRAGGPAHLEGELARISSDRNVINPLIAGPTRNRGQESRPLYTGDFSLGISLTGSKSWHHIVPEVLGGVGFISDFQTAPDSGGFKFGTRFALNWGGGIRIVPGGRWQIRGDIKNRLYSMSYPESFFVAPAGGTALVTTTTSKSFWTNNPAFTLGLSYLF